MYSCFLYLNPKVHDDFYFSVKSTNVFEKKKMLPSLKLMLFLRLKIAKYYPKLVQALIVMKLGI